MDKEVAEQYITQAVCQYNGFPFYRQVYLTDGPYKTNLQQLKSLTVAQLVDATLNGVSFIIYYSVHPEQAPMATALEWQYLSVFYTSVSGMHPTSLQSRYGTMPYHNAIKCQCIRKWLGYEGYLYLDNYDDWIHGLYIHTPFSEFDYGRGAIQPAYCFIQHVLSCYPVRGTLYSPPFISVPDAMFLKSLYIAAYDRKITYIIRPTDFLASVPCVAD